MTVLQSWLLILGCCAVCLLVLGPICDRLVDWLEAHCAFYRRLGEPSTHRHEWSAWTPVNPERVAREPHRPRIEGRICLVCGVSDQLRISEYSIIAFPVGVRRKR